MTSKMPTSSELSASLLKVLEKHPNGLSVNEIDKAVIQDLGISTELANLIRSGNRTEIKYRLAWCRTKAKKQGFIERISSNMWKLKQAK